MKKLLILVLFCSGFCVMLSQNKAPAPADTSKIPFFIQQKFTKEYPAISPVWTLDGKNYKAFYTDPKTNIGQLIVYDHDGNVLRRESELDKLADPAKNQRPKKK